jgi:hypothetical protein
MRIRSISLCVVALVAPAIAELQSQAVATAHVERLAWMSGCWQRAAGASVVEEQWMTPRGGVMMGMSRTTRADALVTYEQLRMYERPGRAVYVASPAGQQTAEFEAISTSDTLVVFERLTNDYPQRIIYRRGGGDSLVARIEGIVSGAVRGSDFPFVRVACVNSAPAARTPAPPRTSDLLQAKYDELGRRTSARFNTRLGWYVDVAAPGFLMIIWPTGSNPTSMNLETLTTVATRTASAPVIPVREPRYRAIVDHVVQRGDTADVLLSLRHDWIATDTEGQYGEKGKDIARQNLGRQRDTWVRVGSDWRLLRTEPITSEQTVNGKVVARDGRAIRN